MALAFATLLIMALTIAFAVAVARDVHVVVPVLLHEVDRLAARIVFAAVLPPVFRVTRGNMEIDRLAHDVHTDRLDDDWLRVEQPRRWKISDIDAAIENGLADVDRYANVGRERRDGCCGQRSRDQQAVHVRVLRKK